MARGVHIPVRRSELLALAKATRERYRGLSIDEIAEKEEIILVRMPAPNALAGGFAYSEIIQEDGVRKVIDALVINSGYKSVSGETVSEQEIFWHEFYHLWYSPSRIDSVADFYEYSTRGVLHAQEERRAEEFAAAVLIDQVRPEDTANSLSERHSVTVGLAEVALKVLPKINLSHNDLPSADNS